jgi:serine protease inhibitor
MKTIATFLAVILLAGCSAGILTSCSEPEVQTAGDIPLKAGMEKKVAQDNEFAFDLLRQTIALNDDPNIFISPLSMSMALGMAWNGAAGVTREEMAAALRMDGLSDQEINEYYKIMRKGLLAADSKTKLNIANSIWYREGFPVKDDFLKVNSSYFNAEVRELDFSHPKALDIINGWCAKATNNLIKKPLDKISTDAMLYLINAIYFKGIWAKQFDKKKTYESDFLSENAVITRANMMNQKDTFLYTKDDRAQYLEMPYGNQAFSMTVILPNDGITTGQVLEDLSADQFSSVRSTMKKQVVNVHFPKFKVEQKFEMKDPMMALGMKQAFSDEADFSPISDQRLLISRIIHSTFCEVDEVGTEAAAVTIIEFELTSMPMDPIVFMANKPFIFLIREKSTGVILFVGKIGKLVL